jgi:uncharacterized protein (DUF58 family)
MFIIVLGIIILLLVIIQSAAYRKWWAHELSMDFRFSAKEAVEGTDLILHTQITNKKILPLPWLFLEYELSANLRFAGEAEYDVGQLGKSDLYSVMAYRRVRRRLHFACTKRGYYRLRRVRLAASNLLHTQTYTQDMACTADLTVFPKLIDFEGLDNYVNNIDAMLNMQALINPDPFEFRGIREYYPTDALRSVNFKATAVAQQLMVNIHAPTSSKRVEIILNLEHYSLNPSEDVFEEGIRLAATLAAHYTAADTLVGLVSNGRDAYFGKGINLPCAAGAAQQHKINHALGRLALSYKPGHISNYLGELHDTSCVYVIISTYCGEDFTSALENMLDRRMDFVHIMPAEAALPLPHERTQLWLCAPEVKP